MLNILFFENLIANYMTDWRHYFIFLFFPANYILFLFHKKLSKPYKLREIEKILIFFGFILVSVVFAAAIMRIMGYEGTSGSNFQFLFAAASIAGVCGTIYWSLESSKKLQLFLF
jgi:hypothetical protein